MGYLMMEEDQGSAPQSSTPKEYSFAQIFSYFQYIMDLVGDGYPMNIFTPDEFERVERGEDLNGSN